LSHHGLSITCPNRLAEIGKAAQLIEAFGAAHGLSPEVVFNLNLALDEVVTNIISYAYDDEAEHQIEIRVSLDGDGVSVRVEDDGGAFNPLETPRPDVGLDIDRRPIGGLGVHIVRSLMDALEYRREDDRNIFIMRKRTADDHPGSNALGGRKQD
jgi:anti-sigma regulatory factor (Ser/Thr protein kinase)